MNRVLSLLLALILITANCMVQSTTAEAASKVTKIVLNSNNEQTFAGGV